jgi:CheY-like chemotaxis protein
VLKPVRSIGSNILVVDDDFEVAFTLQRLLESANHNVAISTRENRL